MPPSDKKVKKNRCNSFVLSIPHKTCFEQISRLKYKTHPPIDDFKKINLKTFEQYDKSCIDKEIIAKMTEL
jgi:hypothetical protein